ncbi:DUF4440 domain-containing protein [Parvularcula sp. ZS-1/3]|uniref:DUF4440 domain-containing protein n=1 Tax=Parvularcula mediterranea TaxID=2732508 RepID=A0A7Y3RJX6_9PROT|nr:DUF4440 domain-containing protein [Parvularcula mediterranea]NNU14742.1 DUF4440 domain-containing protein [Parvularcula mediterranea]
MTSLRRLPTLAVATLFVSACGDSAPSAGEDIAALREASSAWVADYNANDWDKLGGHFTDDAVMMPPNGSAVVGAAAIAEWERENETGFRIAFDVQDVAVSGDLAYLRGRSCVFIPDGEGGWGVDVGKFLETRRRQPDGRWLMTADAFNSDAAPGTALASECPFADLP